LSLTASRLFLENFGFCVCQSVDKTDHHEGVELFGTEAYASPQLERTRDLPVEIEDDLRR